MPRKFFPEVVGVVSVKPEQGYTICVLYEDGAELLADLTYLALIGGVFAPLADLGFFKKVFVGGNGAYISWPGEIDICPDTLREPS